MIIKGQFCLFLHKNLFSGCSLESLRQFFVDAILMRTHNIGFLEDLTKIIFQISTNTHLISSDLNKIGSALFALTCTSENLGNNRIFHFPTGCVRNRRSSRGFTAPGYHC